MVPLLTAVPAEPEPRSQAGLYDQDKHVFTNGNIVNAIICTDGNNDDSSVDTGSNASDHSYHQGALGYPWAFPSLIYFQLSSAKVPPILSTRNGIKVRSDIDDSTSSVLPNPEVTRYHPLQFQNPGKEQFLVSRDGSIMN